MFFGSTLATRISYFFGLQVDLVDLLVRKVMIALANMLDRAIA